LPIPFRARDLLQNYVPFLDATEASLADSQILLAQVAWRDNNVPLAYRQLDAVPEHLRHFEWHHLKRHLPPNTSRPPDPQKRLEPVLNRWYPFAMTQDGLRLASVSDKAVKVWDVHTGKELLTIPPQTITVLNGGKEEQATLNVTSLAFSPNGQRLAIADNSVRIWDLSSGKELPGNGLWGLHGHWGFGGVAFSADGRAPGVSGTGHCGEA
jgi:WD40 repeat protein